jgi:hypothetical protein
MIEPMHSGRRVSAFAESEFLNGSSATLPRPLFDSRCRIFRHAFPPGHLGFVGSARQLPRSVAAATSRSSNSLLTRSGWLQSQMVTFRDESCCASSANGSQFCCDDRAIYRRNPTRTSSGGLFRHVNGNRKNGRSIRAVA